MKTAKVFMIVLFLMDSFLIFSQDYNQTSKVSLLNTINTNYIHNYKFWIRGGTIMLGGAADGYVDVLRSRYPCFKELHPNANDQFWNPAKSHTNKYKNGDYKQGEKFFLSTSLLSPLTDGYHDMKMLRNVSFVTAITIPINKNRFAKKRFGEYAFEIVSSCVFYEIGMETVLHIYKY